MSEIPQIIRMIKILQILGSEHKITINHLYHKFDSRVTKRALQRDMLKLSEAGVPLVNEKGLGNENNWYLLNNTPSIPNIPLTLREQIACSFLKQSIQLLKGTRLESDLKGVFHKLEQLISPSVVDILDYLPTDSAFDTFIPGIYDYSNHGHIIDDLIRAIRGLKKCDIMYSSLHMNEPQKRTIYPQRILIYGEGYTQYRTPRPNLSGLYMPYKG